MAIAHPLSQPDINLAIALSCEYIKKSSNRDLLNFFWVPGIKLLVVGGGTAKTRLFIHANWGKGDLQMFTGELTVRKHPSMKLIFPRDITEKCELEEVVRTFSKKKCVYDGPIGVPSEKYIHIPLKFEMHPIPKKQIYLHPAPKVTGRSSTHISFLRLNDE